MTDYSTWTHKRRPTDGAEALTDPQDARRRLYRYPGPPVRFGATSYVKELPDVPHSTNERQEAANTRERLRQIGVLRAAFEGAGSQTESERR